MRARLSKLWDFVINSYWFLPGLLTVASFLLALGMAEVDRRIEGTPGDFFGPLYGGKPESARQILVTIAGSVMTVVSLAFSVTVVALTLAANQFGPRLLYNFMRDRANQIVLGVFIGTFIYCLMILRMVGGGTGEWVPHLSVMTALALALVSVGTLIFFIHHMVQSIQANNVVASVADDLEHTIQRVFPPRPARPPSAQETARAEQALHLLAAPAGELRAAKEGILQAVDHARLLRIASQRDLTLRLNVRPGQFILRNAEVFQVWPAERASLELSVACSEALLTGARRTLVQDADFAFDQLVEVALRALSPSLNDAFTAIACADRLGAGLACVARRAQQPSLRFDDAGNLRLVVSTSDFQGLTKRVFDPLRRNARGNLSVLLHLLEVIAALLEQVKAPEQRGALLAQAEMIHRDALDCARTEPDQADVQRRYRDLSAAAAPRLRRRQPL